MPSTSCTCLCVLVTEGVFRQVVPDPFCPAKHEVDPNASRLADR